MKSTGLCSNRGYSLVEVLIAITILGLVSTGIMVTFITGQREYSERDATIRMQQQARVAMSEMEREIKMAGSGLKGLGNLKINVYQYPPGVKTTWGIVEPGDGVGGPDRVTIIYQKMSSPMDDEKKPTDTPQVTLFSNMPLSKDELSVETDTSITSIFQAGDLFLVYNSEDMTMPASMLQVSSLTVAGVPGSGDKINHVSNTASYPFNPPNSTDIFPTGGYKITKGGKVLNLRLNDIRRISYSVDGTNLVRDDWSSVTRATTRHVVATGIEDLQVMYLFTDGKWLHSFDASHDVDSLRGVRISVIARTANADSKYLSTQVFKLTGPMGNGIDHSGGGYRRMTMSSMVSMRNLAMRDAP